MARYRQVHTSFWQDAFVLDLTPEEKYFYLYLMTNSKTTQCGIYEIPKKIMELETGYNRETVDKLLQRFINYGKIAYSRKSDEVALINWPKYNTINSPKVQKCVESEMEKVKDKSLIPLLYGIDTPCKDYGEEEEEEREEEREEEKEVCIGQTHSAIFNHWNSKQIIQHRKLTQKTISKINSKLKDYTPEEIMQAIDNYARVLDNPDKYYFTYRWQLWEFLDRGLEKMLDWEIVDRNYRKDKPKKAGVNSDYMKERLAKAKALDEMEGPT